MYVLCQVKIWGGTMKPEKQGDIVEVKTEKESSGTPPGVAWPGEITCHPGDGTAWIGDIVVDPDAW